MSEREKEREKKVIDACKCKVGSHNTFRDFSLRTESQRLQDEMFLGGPARKVFTSEREKKSLEVNERKRMKEVSLDLGL